MTVMLNVRNALSVSGPENKITAKVFPNPASDFVYLEITDSEQQTAFLNVYALNGSKVLPQKTIQVNSGANMFIIESKSWTPGTYIIHVQGDNGLNLNQMLIVE